MNLRKQRVEQKSLSWDNRHRWGGVHAGPGLRGIMLLPTRTHFTFPGILLTNKCHYKLCCYRVIHWNICCQIWILAHQGILQFTLFYLSFLLSHWFFVTVKLHRKLYGYWREIKKFSVENDEHFNVHIFIFISYKAYVLKENAIN